MAKHSLLLVDGDTRSLRLLEVTLRKAGYQVTTSINGVDALSRIELARPDLIIAGTHMAEMDGFELCKRLKQDPQWAHVPFIFLADQKDIEDKIQGLELGVDDYLTKPIYLKEIVSRVQILLEKQHRGDQLRSPEARTQFRGHLQDMAVVDLIQTIEIGRKSGVIHFQNRDSKRGSIYFKNGKVIDAEMGHLSGEDAVYRLLNWTDGSFNVEFKSVRRRETIELSSQGLLMEGMRRVDEWSRLCEQIPSLDAVMEVDPHELGERLPELPDEVNGILKLFDGRRTIMDVVDDCEFGDLEALNIIARLCFEALLVPAQGNEILINMPRLDAVPEPLPSPRLTPVRPAGAGNVIQFPVSAPLSVPTPGPIPSLRGSVARPVSVRHAAPATAPNDLLEPVAGETLHVPRPQPAVTAQPSVIVQDGEPSRPPREMNAPELLPEPDDLGDGPAYRQERTERVEAFIPPPQKEILPYAAIAALLAAGLALGLVVFHTSEPASDSSRRSDAPSIENHAPPSAVRTTENRKPPPLLPDREGQALVNQPAPPSAPPRPATPETPPAPAAIPVDNLLAQARLAYKRGGYEKAERFVEQVLAEIPESSDAIALQALIALAQGQQSRAAELAQTALTINANTADAHLVLGTVDLGANKTASARAHYERYLRLSPKGPHADELRTVLKNMH